jgi:hypothetical protein
LKVKALLIGCLLAGLTTTEVKAVAVVKEDVNNVVVFSDTDIQMEVSYGPGVHIDGYSGGALSSNYWNNDATDYLTFTITPTGSDAINLTSISFDAEINNKGPQTLKLEYSTDGWQTVTYVGNSISLSKNDPVSTTIDLPGFDNVTAPVEFRLYGTGANVSGNDRGGQLTLSGFSVIGAAQAAGSGASVEAVPEPQSLALIGVGSLLMTGYLRRARKVADPVA